MKEKTDVLFNGACPICSREVAHYARLSDAARCPITFDNLGDPDRLAQWNISAEEAAKRFHVRQNGQLYSGLPAFVILWGAIPRTRWLARIFNLPGLHWIASKAYDHIAAPLLYARHRRRQG